MAKKFTLLTATILSVGWAASASAQTAENVQGEAGIQEIIVTAQKRAENVQDVPIAVSAFTASALQERAVTSVDGLSNLTPNVTLDAGTPFSGSSSVLAAFIRGIGANDFAFNIDPGVGIYLDGVYLARSVGANQDLPDVERVEILKGPQGTLFGRNTIGGAISIVTHDPGKDFSFKGDVTTGSHQLFHARGTADIPITDALRSSVSFSIKNRRGYQKRVPFPGFAGFNNDPITSFRAAGYDTSEYEGGDGVWNGRLKLVYNDGGPFKATLAGDYSDLDQSASPNSLILTTPIVFAGTYNCAIAGLTPPACDGGGPPSFAYRAGRGGQSGILDLPGIFGVNVDADPRNNRLPFDNRFVTTDPDISYANGNSFSKLRNYGTALTLDYELSKNVAIKSITAYRELHWRTGSDLDGSPLNFLHTSFIMNQKQFSQELQLNGTAADEVINYVFGAYYFKESGNLHDYVTFAEGLLQIDGLNNLATKNYAFFGQIDLRPSDKFGITIGGRYTHEDKEFEGFQSDRNGQTYKILQAVGVLPCASITPISEACRIAAGFPNPGEPLRYYIAGVNHKRFNNFSPKIGLQYHPTDDVMLYASWSKGYKTGGWTTRLQNPLPYAPGFDEEKATTWEAGFKSTWLDRRLQINAAAFSTFYKGIQLNFQRATSPTVENAGNARIKGFEIEAVVAPADGFLINASVGYTDAHYTSLAPQALIAANPFLAGISVGAPLPKTPKWKFNISPRYETALGNGGKLILLADYTHSSSLWNDTERSYGLFRKAVDSLNAGITYREPDEHWDITVGATNITDGRHIVTGLAQLAGGIVHGTYSRPREWYARLGVKF